MRFILKFLLFLIILLLLVAAGLGAFVYFKYDINPLKAISQVSNFNKAVDEATLVTNPIAYKNSGTEEKIDSINSSTSSYITFYDYEIGYYLNKSINDNNMTLKEVTFLQIEDNNQEVNFKAILEINLKDLLGYDTASFPLSLAKHVLPDTMYVTLETSYTDSNHQLYINNNLDDSELFKAFSLISSSYGKENLAKSISDKLYKGLYENNGFIKRLLDKGGKGYSFNTSDNKTVLNLFVTDTTKDYYITYQHSDNIQKTITNLNPTSYKITDNEIILKDASADGYTFLGYYDLEDNQITRISPLDAKDLTLVIKFQPIEYTITLELNGGTLTTGNIIKYTVESDDIHIENPTKKMGEADIEFKGWIGGPIEAPTKDLVIFKGSYGNLTLNATYEGETVNVTLYITGTYSKNILLDTGSTLTLNVINEAVSEKLTGFTATKVVDNTNNDYDMTKVLYEDITLYCQDYKYIIDSMKFGPYLSEFSSKHKGDEITVESTDMLDAYISYVIFYELTQDEIPTLKLEYTDEYTIHDAVTNYINDAEHFTANSEIISSNNYVCVKEKTLATFAKNTADPSKEYIYTKIPYLFKNNYVSERAEDFDDFKINYRPQSLDVEYSYQLYYAVMNGFKPNCKAGSIAETLYNKAKEILRTLCDDRMTDEEKLHQIYEWESTTIHYDHYAASTLGSASPELARTYDSWALEGALLNNVAVCEGYSKALILLAGIEGIPAIEVSGSSHQWNKVYVDSYWYNLDATFATSSLVYDEVNSEIFTNRYFLFKDAFRPDYKAKEFTKITCETPYNYYIKNHNDDFDLNITTLTESIQMVNYIKTNAVTNKPYCLELTFKSNLDLQGFLQELQKYGTVSYSTKDYNSYFLGTIIFSKN